MSQKIKLHKVGGKTLRVEAELDWIYAKMPNSIVAVCPLLGITLEGDTLPEVLGMIPDSVNALFKSLDKHDEWDAYSKEMKWPKTDAAALQRTVREVPTGLPRFTFTPVTADDLAPAACG